jgi:DNA repair protein RecN (Recombination protein N)
MLKSLHIKNYALIEELTVEFERGLNIITGETGAGKSIIIDALSLILGERADISAIRKGAEKAVVEGILLVAENQKLTKLLTENSIEAGEELILRRELSVKGQSRSFINDTPATITLLKEVGDLLVDLHGQHEHQSLLRSETHIDMLDDYGSLDGLVREFGNAYHVCRATMNNLRELRAREHQLMEKRSFYEFQLKEIDAVHPHPGEEAELESELLILENAERLHSATDRLYQLMYEGENAVHDQMVIVRNELENLSGIDKNFEEARDEASSAVAIVNELAKFIQQYNSRIEFNPERLEEIRNRLGNITMLKKKYGGALAAVLDHRNRISKELELANNFDTEIASLSKRLDDQRKICIEIGQRLSTKRDEVAKKINRSVVQALGDLGIVHPRFETKITVASAKDAETAVVKLGKQWIDASPKGIDQIEFYISTNIGEDLKPLVKVASGGEISRIMLALKMILAKSDRLPLLIFDEIDVGISGRIAQAVGQSLKKLSQFHQVISISHLPQIAGLADTHFIVEKIEDKKRSFTRMRKLDLGERVNEVAQLMSGVEVTEHGLESARELMGIK